MTAGLAGSSQSDLPFLDALTLPDVDRAKGCLIKRLIDN